MAHQVELRRGFRRIGRGLFLLMAALSAGLWAAQAAGLIALGLWLLPLILVLLALGLVGWLAIRLGGLAVETAARSGLARQGAAAVSERAARLGFFGSLVLGFLPGAKLLTAADLLSAVDDGTFADGVRGQFRFYGFLVAGLVALPAGGYSLYRLVQGGALASLKPWLIVAAIGLALIPIVIALADWAAAGFRRDGSNPPGEGPRP